MTSEPDSTPRRRPPTIDLTATEIDTEKPAQTAPGSESVGEPADGHDAPGGRAAWNFAGKLQPLAIGAGAGAIIMAAVIVGLWLAGLVPPLTGAPAAGVTSPNAGTGGQISAQLDKIQTELQARQPDTAASARLSAVEAQTKVFNDSLAALNRRLDGIAVAAQSALEHADAATEAAKGAATGTVQRSDVEALADRIASLENTVRGLSNSEARRPSSTGDHAARAALAAEALRAAVERGASFQAELATVKSFGVDHSAIAPLEPFAADGVPAAADLAHELAALTPQLLQASGGAPAGGSFLGRLEDNAKGLVRITPVDAPPSDEPPAVVARIDADAARDDIAGALADIARLPQSAKTLAEPWVQKVDARNAAIAASRRIAADALAGLGNTNTQ
jgi:hypothetical protein